MSQLESLDKQMSHLNSYITLLTHEDQCHARLIIVIYTVSQKNVHLFVFQITLCQKLTNFNDSLSVTSCENLTAVCR